MGIQKCYRHSGRLHSTKSNEEHADRLTVAGGESGEAESGEEVQFARGCVQFVWWPLGQHQPRSHLLQLLCRDREVQPTLHLLPTNNYGCVTLQCRSYLFSIRCKFYLKLFQTLQNMHLLVTNSNWIVSFFNMHNEAMFVTLITLNRIKTFCSHHEF